MLFTCEVYCTDTVADLSRSRQVNCPPGMPTAKESISEVTA